MDCGTVMSRSITDGAPSRLPVLTTTVFPTRDTSTRPRRPASPCTLTRFSVHPWTVIPPPKLLTERLAPAGTAMLVSDCLCGASVTSIAAASVANMSVLLLGSSRGHVVHTPQQLHLAPHRVGEMEVQVSVAGIVPQRNARLGDRPIDDGQIFPHDAYGRRIEPLFILRQRGLQLADGDVGGAGPTGNPRACRSGHGARLGGVRRSLPQGQPCTATRKEDQSNARRKELRDGETEPAAGEGRVPAYPGPAARGQPSFYIRPEIRLRLTICESLRARDHMA